MEPLLSLVLTLNNLFILSVIFIIIKEIGLKISYKQPLKQLKSCLLVTKWISKNKEKSLPKKPNSLLSNTIFHTFNAVPKVVSQ